MALLSHYGLVTPCHTLIFHIPKVQLDRGLNYDRIVKNKASISNNSKKKRTLVLSHYGLVTLSHTLILHKSKVQLDRRLDYDRIFKNKAPIFNGNIKKKRGFMRTLINSMLDDNDGILLQQSPSQGASIFKSPSTFQSYLSFTKGILEMSRLQNYLPSMVLVFVGGWMGCERNIETLMRPGQVWIVAGCSSLITMASMLVNDIFDFRSGTDHANGKTSPLLQGQVHPHQVELVAGCLYGASVIGLCYLEPMSLRLLIGGAAVATYIYTPILKQLTMVKNVVVSGIISSLILAGALAIGGKEQLQNPVVVAVALFLFLCILSRELLMDVGDMVGDKAAGVNTLAVRFGGQIGTLTASFCLAAANALLISLLAVKAQAFAAIGTLSLLPLHAKMLALSLGIGASKETSIVKSIQQVVQQSMVPIGFGVLVLASAA